MDRRSLRLIRTLADAGHFGRAAERLGTAQPHLSSALKALETSLGVRLFERRPVVRLTPQGELVLRAAERAFGEVDQAVETARRVEAGLAGVVSVGFASSVMLTELALRLRAFQQARPDVGLTLIDMHSGPQWEALASGRLDVALTREIKPAVGVRSELVLRERLLIALPEDHPLAEDGGAIALRALAEEPFVLFSETVAPKLHAGIIAACVAEGFVPHVAQAADEWQTVLAFVGIGLGVTIAPACALALPMRGVAFREILGGRREANIFLCHRPGGATPAVDSLLASMRGGAIDASPKTRPSERPL